jgi:hypothetical protein
MFKEKLNYAYIYTFVYDTSLYLNNGSRTRDRAKLGPGVVKKIADLTIINKSKGKSGSHDHAARVGMQNRSRSKSLLHLTSLK